MIKIKSLFVLVSILVLTAACSNSDNDSDSDVARLQGKIVSYNEFDGAMLDITEADMTKEDFAQAFTSFLLTHGISQDQIDALVSALTTNHLLRRR